MLGLFGGFDAEPPAPFSLCDVVLLVPEVSMVNPSGLEAKRYLVSDVGLSLFSSCEGKDVCELPFSDKFDVDEDDLESLGSGS